MHDLVIYGSVITSAVGALVSVIVTYWTYRRTQNLERALRTKEGTLPRTPNAEDEDSSSPDDDIEKSEV